MKKLIGLLVILLATSAWAGPPAVPPPPFATNAETLTGTSTTTTISPATLAYRIGLGFDGNDTEINRLISSALLAGVRGFIVSSDGDIEYTTGRYLLFKAAGGATIASINSYTDNALYINQLLGDIVFRTTASYTERLRINQTGGFSSPGFSVDADGDVTAKSYSTTRVDQDNITDNHPSMSEYYEDTDDGDNMTTVRPQKGVSPTVKFPYNTGSMMVDCTASHDYASGTDNWTLTTAESYCNYISVTAAGGGVIAKITTPIPGHTYTVNNASGQELTFKAAGGTGAAVANGKWSFFTTLASDVAQVYTLP